MDSRVVTSVWKQFGKRVESAVKDKLILDGKEIHPLKTSHLGHFGPNLTLSSHGVSCSVFGAPHIRQHYKEKAEMLLSLSALIGSYRNRNEVVSVRLQARSFIHSKQSKVQRKKCEMGFWWKMYLFSLGVFCLIVCFVSQACCSFALSHFRFQFALIRSMAAWFSGKTAKCTNDKPFVSAQHNATI